MTLLQITNYAVDVPVAGVTIVFGMLVLLVAIISIFGKFMSKATSKPKTKKEEKPQAAKAQKPVVTSAPAVQEDSDELIAVISAAVYSMYEGTGVKPVIKAIRPSVGRNAWSMVGIRQNTKSFF